MIDLSYPPPPSSEDEGTGLFPVDFLLEDALRVGFEWFKTDPKAPNAVFSHLGTKFLSTKYGQAKINEIAAFIKKYDIRIVQHFSMIDEQMPTISIQLLDGSEMVERTAFADFAGTIDALNEQNEVIGRTEIKYTPVFDNIHIGIHTSNTPDLCKYLYYLIVYILLLFKPELEKRGLQLSTFRATDISKLNEYLPSNIYSRFINFSTYSVAKIDAGSLPMIKAFQVQVSGEESGVGASEAGASGVSGVEHPGGSADKVGISVVNIQESK